MQLVALLLHGGFEDLEQQLVLPRVEFEGQHIAPPSAHRLSAHVRGERGQAGRGSGPNPPMRLRPDRVTYKTS